MTVFNKTYCNYFRKLSPAALEARGKLYKLSEFPPGTVFEVMTEKRIKTVNGESLLIEFSTAVGREKMEGKLIIPNRVVEEVEGRTPIIMVYTGKKMSKNQKEFHDLSFIDVEKCPIMKRKKAKSRDSTVRVPQMHNEETLMSYSDIEEDEDIWTPPVCQETDECNVGRNVCYGFCLLCHEHMPYNGSQCRCVLKGSFVH